MPLRGIPEDYRTQAQRERVTKFFGELGRYITGQAEGTIPHHLKRTIGLPERLRTGEQRDFSPAEALDFSLLAMGPPRGGGVAGMGPKKLSRKEIKRILSQQKKTDVPNLTNTEQALAFGRKASPGQVEQLKILRAKSLTKQTTLKEAGKLQEYMDEATRGQFFREAIERTKKK